MKVPRRSGLPCTHPQSYPHYLFLTHVKSSRHFHVRDYSQVALQSVDVCICIRTCLTVHSEMQKAGFSKCPHVLHLIRHECNWVAQGGLGAYWKTTGPSKHFKYRMMRMMMMMVMMIMMDSMYRMMLFLVFIKVGLVNFSPLNVHHPFC